MTLLSLQKAIALLMMPVGFLWLLLLGVSALAFRKKQWPLAWLLVGLAVLYGALGNVWVGSWLMARLESSTPVVDPATLEPLDVLFVLGGGSQEDPAGGPQASQGGDRVVLAARLWHAGKARLLVASGCGRGGVRGVMDLGEETRALWRDLGIPDSAILVVKEPCWITRDEIAAYRKRSDRFGWRRMGLLSSAYHLPRALGLAEKAGLKVTGIGADWRGQARGLDVKYLIPQQDGFADTQLACWEWVGRWIGR